MTQEKEFNAERFEKRLDLLDERLDNIDSIVSALGERVLRQPLVMAITCPNCGQVIEISITGTQRQRG